MGFSITSQLDEKLSIFMEKTLTFEIWIYQGKWFNEEITNIFQVVLPKLVKWIAKPWWYKSELLNLIHTGSNVL